jgi:hypothetical protein
VRDREREIVVICGLQPGEVSVGIVGNRCGSCIVTQEPLREQNRDLPVFFFDGRDAYRASLLWKCSKVGAVYSTIGRAVAV